MRETIKDILSVNHNIYAAFIFGSFGTDEFADTSDIDIAIEGELELVQRLKLETELVKKLDREVDLVIIDELPQYLQLQILVRNDRLFITNEELYFDYLDKINEWYKYEFPFWKKLMIEKGHKFE